jgi:hypothetical protein
VAQVCNPSYTGSGDQEDHSLRQTWAINYKDPHLN